MSKRNRLQMQKSKGATNGSFETQNKLTRQAGKENSPAFAKLVAEHKKLIAEHQGLIEKFKDVQHKRDEAEEQHAIMMADLEQCEYQMFSAIMRLDAFAIAAEGKTLASALTIYGNGIQQTHQAYREKLKHYKQDADYVMETHDPMVFSRLEAVQKALETYPQTGNLAPEAIATLQEIARVTDPNIITIYQIEQKRRQEEAERTVQEATQARIDALTSKERHVGLMKWGIRQVTSETGKTATPATGILLDRLQPAFDDKRLPDELRDVYLDLKTRYEQSNNRKFIKDVMDYEVIEVPWPNGSTRL